MKNQITILILLFMSLQSCVVYEKMPINVADAQGKGKVKVIYETGQESKFNQIVLKDSTYYGSNLNHLGEQVLYPFHQNQNIKIYPRKIPVAKNSFHTSFTGYMMAGSAFSINYDRRIGKSIWITTGFGGYPYINDEAKKIDFKLTVLTGKRSSHLELAAGIAYGRSKPREPYYTVCCGWQPGIPTISEINPAFTIGYRYQNPKGGVVFRTGVGYYEAYVGLGYSF